MLILLLLLLFQCWHIESYGITLYYNLPKIQLNRLQHIQNSLARAVVAAPRSSSPDQILKSLHWLTVQERIEYKIISTIRTSFYSFPVPSTFALPPSLHDLLALRLWSPFFVLQFSRVSRSLTVLFDVQHLCCGINFPILSAFHISRMQHIALLCPHPLIADLLSTYLTVSFILG